MNVISELLQARVNRRHFLQGAGVALSLPFLESSMVYGATNPRRLVCVGNHLGFWPGGFFPEQSGKDYETSLSLKYIDSHRDDFTIFSNLDHGTGGGHSGVHVFLSSIRKEEAAGFPEKNMTLDQVAAEHVGSTTRFPSITAGLGGGTDMVWTRSGVNVAPINNPARIFQALFVQNDAATQSAERRTLSNRGSVLDALLASAKTLDGQLNAADRGKLDQYLTSVRDVERRLQMSREWLDKPKPESPIEPVEDLERMQIEEMPLFYDLLTLALQTDSTRVATFEIPLGFKTSELNLGGYHGLSHHGKDEGRLKDLQIVEKYLLTQFARFLDRLKEAKVFDDTLIVLGSGMGDGSRHSNRNLPVILAGGGLKHQGHLVCPDEAHKRIPLSNLWLSVLQWFGVERDSFGKSTGTFSAMEIA